jgi:hypothetical protein
MGHALERPPQVSSQLETPLAQKSSAVETHVLYALIFYH